MHYFELRSENLTNLGGPMGSDYTFDNWSKSFSSMEKAMKAAERDYYEKEKGEDKIVWKGGSSRKSTQDLRFVQYHITKTKID
jgi:hypothetical protein